MSIRVESYAGYRGGQEPRPFWPGEHRLEVQIIVDRWFAPTQRWFKVTAHDGNVLRHDDVGDEWGLAALSGAKGETPDARRSTTERAVGI